MSQYAPQDPYNSAPQQPAPDPYQPGQPGAYPGQQPAGYPNQYPYPQPFPAAPEHPQGTMILVLGLVSLAVSPLGFVAWYLGKKAEDEMEATGGYYANAGNIKTGKIVGIVTSIITIVGAVFMVAYIAIMIIMFGTMMATMPS